ncbi:MAG: TolC family protein [Vulcanimicrobiaceae bacterium]
MNRSLATLALIVFGAALAAPGRANPQQSESSNPSPAPPPEAASVNIRVPNAAATIPPPPPIPVLPRVPSVAPGYTAPTVTTPSGNIIGVLQHPFVGIALNNAIAMAITHNSDLAIAQGNRRISGYQIVAARGAYNVSFMVEPLFQHVQSPSNNPLFGGAMFAPETQNITQVDAGIQGILRSGAQYKVLFQSSRTTDNNVATAFSPYYPTSLSLSFSQPLMKNNGINQESLTLNLSQVNADSSNQQALITAENTIANVENTYWDLVSAWRNLANQEVSLQQVTQQQVSNTRLARHGAKAPIDAVESSTQVSLYQANVFAALQAVSALQNQLKSLLVTDSQDPIWFTNIVPTTAVLQLPAEPTLDAVIMQALQNRPELAQVRDLLRSAGYNLAFAQNQVKPDISLDLGYTSDGLAGTALPTGNSPLANLFPPVPGYLKGGLGQSLGNLFSGRYPNYIVGLKFQVPMGNETARANLAQAREQARIAALQERNTMQQIAMQARNALQSFTSAEDRLASASAARKTAEQVLASELRRYRNGESTTFLVLQRQVELSNNQSLELQAQTDLNKAVVALEKVTGTILSSNNVNVNTVGEGALGK